MSEESAFLTSIHTNPEDDTTRLVYADWLQERNDPRAEYLRLEIRRHRRTAREKKQPDDLFYPLQELRKYARPGWLSRIDRTMRLSMFWPQDVCSRAERTGLVGQPLTTVHSRGNHNTHFPKAMESGDYLYVFAFRSRLMIVARMRIERRREELIGPFGLMPAMSYTTGVEGTEGTPIRLDLAVPDDVMSRLSWFSGKKERSPNLNAEGRLSTPTSVSGVLRLTPRTAADLDAILRGDSLP